MVPVDQLLTGEYLQAFNTAISGVGARPSNWIGLAPNQVNYLPSASPSSDRRLRGRAVTASPHHAGQPAGQRGAGATAQDQRPFAAMPAGCRSAAHSGCQARYLLGERRLDARGVTAEEPADLHVNEPFLAAARGIGNCRWQLLCSRRDTTPRPGMLPRWLRSGSAHAPTCLPRTGARRPG